MRLEVSGSNYSSGCPSICLLTKYLCFLVNECNNKCERCWAKLSLVLIFYRDDVNHKLHGNDYSTPRLMPTYCNNGCCIVDAGSRVSDGACNLITIHARHLNIHKNYIIFFFHCFFQGSYSVLCYLNNHLTIESKQCINHHHPIQFIVFDN